MFEFIFQGTQEEFEFFIKVEHDKVPDSWLELDKQVDNEWHCNIMYDNNMIFEVGMIQASCYSKFGHLENTIFNQNK